MRLIEREDLDYINATGMTYWVTLDENNKELPGPFLFCVNNTGAWLGVYRAVSNRVAVHQIHHDTVDLTRGPHWQRAVEVWLRDTEISRLQMMRRYLSIEKRLKTVERRWSSWEDLYIWPDESDLMWDGLSVHRHITAREIDGVRSVLWTGNGAWLRHWERQEAQHVSR